VVFPAFVDNLRDPLMIFRDAPFHAACFHRHPLAQRALQRVSEQRQRYDKICAVCRQSIVHYSEYVTLGYLTEGAPRDCEMRPDLKRSWQRTDLERSGWARHARRPAVGVATALVAKRPFKGRSLP